MKRVGILLAGVALVWTGIFHAETVFAEGVQRTECIESCKDAGYMTNRLFAAETSTELPVLSLDFLKDTWVNENGYVCSYENDMFCYGFHSILKECKVTKTGIQGSNAMQMEDETVTYSIEVIDKDSIKVNGITAYRCESETAKEFLSKIKETVKGNWIFTDGSGSIEVPLTVTNSEFQLVDPETSKNASYSYSFNKFKLVVSQLGAQDTPLQVKVIDPDHIELSDILITLTMYRKDSKAYENYQNTKNEFLVGTWIYADSDPAKSEKWEITKDQITCTPFKKNGKAKVVSYQIKRDKSDVSLVIGNKTYNIVTLFGVNILSTEKGESASLLAYDSKEGKHELENIKISNKNGKVEKRSYAASVPDDLIKKAKITLNCKNNIVFEKAITFGSWGCDYYDKCCLAGLLVSFDFQYKKASLTIQYDAKKLGKVKESNLAMGYYKDSKLVVLKTKVNKKNHTITAAYKGGDQIFIIDKAQYKKGAKK